MPQLQERYFFQAEIKKIGRVQVKNADTGKYEDGVKIRGYASTNDLDRGNDVVLPEAFRKTIQRDYKRNPIILAQHDTNRPIGKATSMEIDSQGLLIEAIVYEDEYARLVDKEVLKTFSIGYFPTVVEYHDLETDRLLDPTIESDFMQIWWDEGVKRIIKELELYEVSIVSLPMNQGATFSLAKSVKSFLKDSREALRLQYHPSLNPSDMEKNRKNLLDTKEDEDNKEEQEQEKPVEQPKPEAPQDGGDSESTDEAEGVGEKPAAPAESTEGEDGEKSVQAKADEKSGEEDEEEEAEGEDEEADDEKGEEVEKTEEGEKPADDESKGVEIDPRLVTAKNVKTLMDAAKLLTVKNADLEEEVEALKKQLDITPEKRAAANFQESSMPSKKAKEGEEEKNQPKVEKAGFKAAFMKSAS